MVKPHTSYGVKCKPVFSWLVSSPKLFSSLSMEKFKVKLKGIFRSCIRNAFWSGLAVIPPLNLITSNEKGSPNKGAVKRRTDWFVIRFTKDSLIKLCAVASDSTANTTFVMFGPADSKDIISTCHKKETISWLRENKNTSNYIQGCQFYRIHLFIQHDVSMCIRCVCVNTSAEA